MAAYGLKGGNADIGYPPLHFLGVFRGGKAWSNVIDFKARDRG